MAAAPVYESANRVQIPAASTLGRSVKYWLSDQFGQFIMKRIKGEAQS
jgi:hypothetical protein